MSSNQNSLYLTPLTSKPKRKPFAVYDLETTTDLERVYLCGFYDGDRYRYFESKLMLPEKRGSAVDQFLEFVLGDDYYCGHWIYAHNGGNFDSLYLIRWLIERPERFHFNVIPVQATVLSLEVIERKVRRNRRKWTFIDSLRLMNASLDKLGKAFGLGGKLE